MKITRRRWLGAGSLLPLAFLASRAGAQEHSGHAMPAESVRDYWIARSALRAATGGLLPGDTDTLPPAAGPDDIVPTPAVDDPPAQEHEHHGDHQS